MQNFSLSVLFFLWQIVQPWNYIFACLFWNVMTCWRLDDVFALTIRWAAEAKARMFTVKVLFNLSGGFNGALCKYETVQSALLFGQQEEQCLMWTCYRCSIIVYQNYSIVCTSPDMHGSEQISLFPSTVCLFPHACQSFKSNNLINIMCLGFYLDYKFYLRRSSLYILPWIIFPYLQR